MEYRTLAKILAYRPALLGSAISAVYIHRMWSIFCSLKKKTVSGIIFQLSRHRTACLTKPLINTICGNSISEVEPKKIVGEMTDTRPICQIMKLGGELG